ncbi:hypothetical protein H5410_004195 [Solanum commersonii]|uniref:Uncharacterized protein n=1 Tax=Solanum commersonii TaxID=4109 RepID=A0A9J6B6Z3_SOLCO|nr:hypothetical protein H5410_004195 [Solanum commersonii]
MSETIQQIKEQVMNLARRPTTSAPDNTDNESDEDDYVEPTLQFRSLDIYELFTHASSKLRRKKVDHEEIGMTNLSRNVTNESDDEELNPPNKCATKLVNELEENNKTTRTTMDNIAMEPHLSSLDTGENVKLRT